MKIMRAVGFGLLIGLVVVFIAYLFLGLWDWRALQFRVIFHKDKIVHLMKIQKVKKRAGNVELGMTRKEVEEIFPNEDGGISFVCASDEKCSYSVTYYERPMIKVDVPYFGYSSCEESLSYDCQKVMGAVVNGSLKVYKAFPAWD